MHAIVILTPVGQNMSKKKLIPESRRVGKYGMIEHLPKGHKLERYGGIGGRAVGIGL
jgi:hypothetical protein